MSKDLHILYVYVACHAYFLLMRANKLEIAVQETLGLILGGREGGREEWREGGSEGGEAGKKGVREGEKVEERKGGSGGKRESDTTCMVFFHRQGLRYT